MKLGVIFGIMSFMGASCAATNVLWLSRSGDRAPLFALAIALTFAGVLLAHEDIK